MLPLGYLSQLLAPERTTANRAILLAWTVTNGTQAPREMQLRATLATHYGQDSVINAGTGSGKTLPIALNILLDDPQAQGITLTISPLKRLEITQENDFKLRYGIPTIAINEDTPREDKYWHQNMFSLATISSPPSPSLSDSLSSPSTSESSPAPFSTFVPTHS
ncbi:hypothetical protein DXG03_004405 [Asterophora parasitica]|uniref:DEAD/DEAH-box helicase domain-containing protein n=1 Tax=Asterophora parasitica TaxID=117018 RepID=A0A9P7FWM9_9AGAR|nr:hypothetical protein DXG03_004405 [Asterophora parasitica]